MNNPQRLGSFYWYDTETTGLLPYRDRILQFASQRTDLELALLDKPFNKLVRFPPEVLPSPLALAISKIKPSQSLEHGIEEWELMRQLSSHLKSPHTRLIGYNNTRFDDNFLRYGMYRNLLPPYAHEYKNGNYRLDLLNIARLTAALRPDGIDWPIEDDTPVFSQGAIATANGFNTAGLHDALVDVKLCIEIARLIKQAQPKLWQYATELPASTYIQKLLNIDAPSICLHISAQYSNARYCLAPVLPIAAHPKFSNRVIVVDLMSNVELVLNRTAEEIQEALFRSREQSCEENVEQNRPGLNLVTLNQSPVVAPIQTLPQRGLKRLKIDLDAVHHARDNLLKVEGIQQKLQRVYDQEHERESEKIAEESLYDGFISDSDSQLCKKFWQHIKPEKPWYDVNFEDQRLRDLYSRLKVKLAPEQVSQASRTQYREFVREQLTRPEHNLADTFNQTKQLLKSQPPEDEIEVLQDLHSYLLQQSQKFDLPLH